MARAAVLVATLLLAAAGVALAQAGCCNQRGDLTQYGYSYVRQDPPPGEIRGQIIINSTIDFVNQQATQIISNRTNTYVIYYRGDVKRAWAYIPKYNVCSNSTYSNVFGQPTQNCVGPGTAFPTPELTSTIGGLPFESWGSADGQYSIAVSKANACTPIAMVQTVPSDIQFGVFYGLTHSPNKAVFDIPSVCDTGARSLADLTPRQLAEVQHELTAAARAAATGHEVIAPFFGN